MASPIKKNQLLTKLNFEMYDKEMLKA